MNKVGMEATMREHNRVLSTFTSEWATTEMALAMFETFGGKTTSIPTSPPPPPPHTPLPSEVHVPFDSIALGLPSGTATPTPDKSNNNNNSHLYESQQQEQIRRSGVAPSGVGLSPFVSAWNDSLSSSSSNNTNNTSHGRTETKVATADPPTQPYLVVSLNSALERLIGFTREEFRLRLSALGWKFGINFAPPTFSLMLDTHCASYSIDVPLASSKEASILFRHTFLCGMGVRPRWAMEAHVVNKWNVVSRCLMFGRMHSNRYQTFTVSVIHNPLPAPITRVHDRFLSLNDNQIVILCTIT
jgi:hypothetical protein